MQFFLYLGVLIFASFANRAIARFLAARQKPPVPSPFQAPNVPTGTVIPVLYGTQRLPGITTWFGRAKLVSVNVNFHTLFGLLPSTQTLAYQWKVSMMQLYCWGPVTCIRNMVFADYKSLADQPLTQRVVDPVLGFTNTQPTFAGSLPVLVTGLEQGVNQKDWYINLPYLYGGTAKGGGLTAVGGDVNNPYGNRLRFYPGFPNNNPDSVMESFLGAGNVPTYGDLVYHVFDDVNVGESSIPPAIDVILYREPKAENNIPGGAGTMQVNDRMISGLAWSWRATDMSAAAMLFDLFTNQEYGKGEPPAGIHGAGAGVSNGLSGSFEDAQRALVAEGLGMSLVFSGNPSDVDSTVQTILQHIDGVLRRHPVTQLRELKLIRNEAPTDVALAALRAFDESSIQRIDNWGRPDWDDTINAITVTFSNAEKLYQQDTVTLRNHANFAMTGSWRHAQTDYLGFTDKKVALKACARDLKKVSLRLWRGQVKIDRSAWDVAEGDVVRLTYAPYKLAGMVVRVLAVDRGEETNGVITLDVMQDAFSFDNIAFERDLPVVPLAPPQIVAPFVSAIKTEVVIVAGALTGKLTLTLVDAEHRTYEIAYRTVVGGGTPSSWIVTNTATPNTGDPKFPYINPVTDQDFNGDHVFTVPMVTNGPSAIEYRISAIGYGTPASPHDANIILDDSVVIAPPGPTTSTLTDANPIIWDVTGKVDDSASVIISGNRTLVIVGAIAGFKGQLLVTSTNATGNVLTLPAGSFLDTGPATTVTLGLKDQLSVYYDGTYYWWNHDTSSATLPPVPLAGSLGFDLTMTGTLANISGSMGFSGTPGGDIST